MLGGCAKAKKPVVGCELYIAETDHLIHDKSAGHNFHLVLLVMNEDGYRNLMKLAIRLARVKS